MIPVRTVKIYLRKRHLYFLLFSTYWQIEEQLSFMFYNRACCWKKDMLDTPEEENIFIVLALKAFGEASM